jgi:hypothetical protein
MQLETEIRAGPVHERVDEDGAADDVGLGEAGSVANHNTCVYVCACMRVYVRMCVCAGVNGGV